mmetsp:Transcript_15379/g.46088  ORF Transcript_15379/g.46088 Transcript_15379/m.46088 type:complete len:136 (+) Transcript_15379:2-409(+)
MASPPGGAAPRPAAALGSARELAAATGAAAGGGGFDFEARAPWYLYNRSVEGFPGVDTGAVVLPVFSGALVQGASRTVRANLSAQRLASLDWGQAALYLRLTKPPGKLEYDHWDRVASLGLLVDDSHVADGTLSS